MVERVITARELRFGDVLHGRRVLMRREIGRQVIVTHPSAGQTIMPSEARIRVERPTRVEDQDWDQAGARGAEPTSLVNTSSTSTKPAYPGA
jgi:hypothetical protein